MKTNDYEVIFAIVNSGFAVITLFSFSENPVSSLIKDIIVKIPINARKISTVIKFLIEYFFFSILFSFITDTSKI